MTGAGPHATRPVGEGDEPFLRALDAESRAADLGGALDPALLGDILALQYRAREAGWAQEAPGHDDLVVLCDGEPVGRLVLDRRPEGIRVMDIAVLGATQGHGLGTDLLREVIAEADRRGVPVSLHVLEGSRAATLYERLGFRTVSRGGVHRLMERPAAVRSRGARGPSSGGGDGVSDGRSRTVDRGEAPLT